MVIDPAENLVIPEEEDENLDKNSEENSGFPKPPRHYPVFTIREGLVCKSYFQGRVNNLD